MWPFLLAYQVLGLLTFSWLRYREDERPWLFLLTVITLSIVVSWSQFGGHPFLETLGFTWLLAHTTTLHWIQVNKHIYSPPQSKNIWLQSLVFTFFLALLANAILLFPMTSPVDMSTLVRTLSLLVAFVLDIYLCFRLLRHLDISQFSALDDIAILASGYVLLYILTFVHQNEHYLQISIANLILTVYTFYSLAVQRYLVLTPQFESTTLTNANLSVLCEQSHCEELSLFLISYRGYLKGKVDFDTIVDGFVREYAPNELNLTEYVRNRVLSASEEEEHEVLRLVHSEVSRMVSENILPLVSSESRSRPGSAKAASDW